LLVDHHPDYGILGLFPMPVNEVEREEGYDPEDPTAYRYRWAAQGNRPLENWQVIHFRILGNDTFLPYGASVVEPARRVWRQLILMEDAVMVYRIVRSPERRVFYVDIGNVAPNDVGKYMEKVKSQIKRNMVVDSDTGQVDLRYNPLSTDEDYFIPIRGDIGSRIETLPGGQFTGDIEDLQYIQNKLFAALKIPKSYLGYEGDVVGKSTLSQEDIRFARTIRRIQQVFVGELYKIAMIHLFSMGYEESDLANFDITMANPSVIEEMQRLELWRNKFEVATAATTQEGLTDRHFIYKRIFQLPDEEIESIEEGKRKDALLDREVEKIRTGQEEQEGMGAEGMPGAEGEMPSGEEMPPEGETPPPEGEPPEGEPITAAKDPNLQSSIPNELRSPDRAKKKKRKILDPNSIRNHVFNTKKNALSDPGDIAALRRVASSPFGESVDEDVDERIFKMRIGQIESQMKDLKNVKVLTNAHFKNKNKKNIIKG